MGNTTTISTDADVPYASCSLWLLDGGFYIIKNISNLTSCPQRVRIIAANVCGDEFNSFQKLCSIKEK